MTDHSGKPYTSPDLTKDEDHWIHRDKLARIESEELQQAAMRIHHQSRGTSKAGSVRSRSQDPQGLGVNGISTTSSTADATEPWPGMQRQRLGSPVPIDEGEYDEPTEDERRNWDLRRPEEIAASSYEESTTATLYKSPGLRKSSSRIPVLASSPSTAVIADPMEGGSPIQRARTQTYGSSDGEGLSFGKGRRASESAAVESASPSPPNDTSSTPPLSSRPVSRGHSSPTKKTTSKSTPGSTTRKTSAQSANRKAPVPANQKNRTASSSSGKDRPPTRSGENRPGTSHNPPEGDPPWLATMYKPDPRLPPDQQIIPTHAKRMQQEMWEKEGKTPSAYDKQFSPVAIRPEESPRSDLNVEKSESPSTHLVGEESSWPLQSPPKSPDPMARPGTGYSTMPKVQNTPPLVFSATQRINIPPPAMQEPVPDEEKGGCACCIVM